MGGRSIYSWEQDDSRRRRRVNAQPLSALSTHAPYDAQPAPRAHPGTFGAWRQHAHAEPWTGYPPAYGATSARAPEPTYPPSNYPPPSYQQPNYPPPSYQQPNYPPPSYQQPAYQQPAYQQPAYQQPSYRQPDGRDSAWLTDQAPAAPRQRTAFWPAVAGQGERAWEQQQRSPEEDESWLEDTQEDQIWEYTAWQERTGGYRPGGEPPREYGVPVPPADPWGQRSSPYRAAPGAWGQSPDQYPEHDPGHYDNLRREAGAGGYGAPRPYDAGRDYGARDAYRPQGTPRGQAARAAGNWMSSQRDDYSGGYSGGYGAYDEADASGVWDEDTAEVSAPDAPGPRLVNMRARAAAMSGMAAQWGRARPGLDAQGHGQRRRGIQRWFHRGPNGKLNLPPTWMMLNLLILLVAGVIAAPHVFAAETHSCGWYTVQSGDTIPGLAQRYHAPAKSIFDANHLTASQQLTAGQRLCIPSQAMSDSIIAPVIHTPSAIATPTPTPTPTPAKPAPTPAPGSVSGAKAFIQFVLPYAKRAHADTGWPTSMIIAQWGVEHGWKLPSFTGYNFGNVASVPGEPTVPGTAAKGSPSHFSYAKTPEDGLRQYLKVAHLKYYEPVTAASKVGANTAAIALGKSPWDAGHYGGASNPGSTLLGVMKSFNLYAYD